MKNDTYLVGINELENKMEIVTELVNEFFEGLIDEIRIKQTV